MFRKVPSVDKQINQTDCQFYLDERRSPRLSLGKNVPGEVS